MSPISLRRAAVAVLACASLALTACGGSSDAPATAADDGGDTRLGLLVPDSTSDTWSALTEAAVNEGRGSQVEVLPDAADDPDITAQVSKVQAFDAESLACFAIAPVDAEALVRPLQAFSKKRVAIFNVGQRLDESVTSAAKVTIASYIGPNDTEIGQKAAREMVAAVPGGGTVALLVGSDDDSSAAQQRAAFKQTAGAALDVVVTEATNDDYATAVKVAAEAISANPGLKGIFASSDALGRAAAKAVEDADAAGAVKVISVGGTLEGLQAVKSGALAATVATYPASVGEVLVRACRQVADGRNVKPRLTTQTWLVKKSNVDAELTAYPDPTQPFPDPLV